jgi:long-chain fatty acid transport protein
MKARLLGISAALAGLAFASGARADGGYYSGVKGAVASGRGGAFVAKADDVSAVELNPAGLTHIGTTIIQIGNRFSYNQHSFTRNPTLDWGVPAGTTPPYVEFPEVRNQTPWQALDPFIGIASNFGLEDWAFAAALYSPAGTAREVYPEDGGQRYMMVRRNAQMINYALSAAWKHQETFGFGATVKWIAVPSLEYGLIIDGSPYNMTANPVKSSLDIRADVKGKDLFTLNAILGAWVRPTPNLELGLSGQILPSTIHTQSNLSVAFAHPSSDPSVDNSITLARNGTPANDVTLDLPLPMNVRLGARYRQMKEDYELFDVELDGNYETWSRVSTFRLDSNNLIASYRGQNVPIGVIDLQKSWQNTLGLHLGGDFAIVPKRMTVRAGVYYETPVSKPPYANIDFPQGAQFGGALGASIFVGKVQISLATEYRRQSQVYVADSDSRVYQQVPGSACKAPYTDASKCNAQYLGVPAPPVNGGTYNAYSLVGTLEAAYRF